MSISSYRSRRNRSKPQPASLGAPFRGVYLVGDPIIDAAAGVATVGTFVISPEGIPEQTEILPRNKEIDVSAVEVYVNNVKTPVVGIRVNAVGNSMLIEWGPTAGSARIIVIPGHPALAGANGSVCGGLFTL